MSKFRRRNISAAKTNPSQVLEIRRRYTEGWTQRQLAKEFRLSVVQIGRIVRGESWMDYEQPIHPQEIAHVEAAALGATRDPAFQMPPELVEKLKSELAGSPSEKPRDAVEEFITRRQSAEEKGDEVHGESGTDPGPIDVR